MGLLPINPEDIYRLWDELSDFGAYACNEALAHCVASICNWAHADNALWIGAIRMVSGAAARDDALSGWRMGAMVNPGFAHQHQVREAIRSLPGDPGETSRAITARAGRFRAYRLSGGELVDLDAFKKSEHYDVHYRQRGIADRIWVVFPVHADAESYFCIDKYGEGSRFSERDMQLAAQALRGIKWFHRQLLLSHGLCVGDEALTDSERQVLQGLLSGASEKGIAERVHLAPGTVHQYAVRIYRKFEVGSRAALMSLWLNGCPDASAEDAAGQ